MTPTCSLSPSPSKQHKMSAFYCNIPTVTCNKCFWCGEREYRRDGAVVTLEEAAMVAKEQDANAK